METLSAAANGSLLAGVYLVYQLPALWTALLLARRFAPRRWCEFLTVAGFLYQLEMIAVPGVLGVLGMLDHLFVASMALAAGVTVVVWKKPWKPLPPERFTAPELLMIALTAGFLFYQWRMFAYLPVIGTDAQTYHIYYPAVWLETGCVERIVQPGLMTATYPCYGELVYCWHMAPVRLDFFARNIQFYHLLLAAIAVVAGGTAAGFRRPAAIAAAAFMVFSGVVFRNASVANTDLMVGANLVIGTALLIPAARRNSTAWFCLAGAAFGVAAATKYLGFLLAPPMLLLLGAGIWFHRRACRKGVLLSFLAAAAVAAPCFIANWITFGNPVFPVRIGIGTFSLFPSYMTEHSPTLGWSLQAWHYFVDGAKNSLSLWNALLFGAGFLALFLYAATAGRRRRGRILLFLAGVWAALLLLQLKLYPSITQPRQIVPLAMLAATASIGGFELLTRRFDGWCVAAVMVAVAWGASFDQISYSIHGVGILVTAAVSALFLLSCRVRRRLFRYLLWLLFGAALLLDAGYRYGVANSSGPLMRARFLSAEDEALLDRIAQESGGRGAVIAYCGLYFYHYLAGGLNRVVSVPVTESGDPSLAGYRDFAAMRRPGSFAAWLARLREAQVDYLVTDPGVAGIPNADLELRWAEEHPELFIPLNPGGRVRAFRLRPEGGGRP